MSTQQTLSQMRDLKLHGMVNNYELQQMNASTLSRSFDERLAMLVEAEDHDRTQRRQQRLLRSSRLKVSSACIEDIKYSSGRALDRQLILSLANCEWIKQHRHLILTGSAGVGKTWLGCAFGQQAIRRDLSVAYRRSTRLVEDLEIAHADGSLPKLRLQLAKPSLLILDDWGLVPMKARAQSDLLELIDDRTGSGSLLITSQLPVTEWHKYLGSQSIADAILDRILHRSYFIEIHGDSMRRKTNSKEDA